MYRRKGWKNTTKKKNLKISTTIKLLWSSYRGLGWASVGRYKALGRGKNLFVVLPKKKNHFLDFSYVWKRISATKKCFILNIYPLKFILSNQISNWILSFSLLITVWFLYPKLFSQSFERKLSTWPRSSCGSDDNCRFFLYYNQLLVYPR